MDSLSINSNRTGSNTNSTTLPNNNVNTPNLNLNNGFANANWTNLLNILQQLLQQGLSYGAAITTLMSEKLHLPEAMHKDEGFIENYKVEKDNAQGKILLTLKYTEKKERVITGLKRISKPGLRIYAGKNELPRVLGGLGIAILSTNQGVITDKEARKLQVGGEVLAFVW